MNVQTTIVPAMQTLGDAMLDEGIHQIRDWRPVGGFTVEMKDGRTGSGETPRAAIDAATALKVAA